MPAVPTVTVIVPVFNDHERLRKCLAALEGQTHPQDRREVLVVDNGSAPGVDAVVSAFPEAQLLHEAGQSSYCARNLGLQHAGGEVIAFTDADCIPAPDWIERGLEVLDRLTAPGVVAGAIHVFPADPRRPGSIELYEMFSALRQHDYVTRGRFGATANLFAARAVFDRIGGFLASVKSGADVEWGQRAVKRGFELVYAADAVVAHPARRTLRELRAKAVRTIGGAHDLKRSHGRAFVGLDRSWLGDWVPPVRQMIAALRDRALTSWPRRLRVIPILVLMRYIEAWERLRLRCGGASQR